MALGSHEGVGPQSGVGVGVAAVPGDVLATQGVRQTVKVIIQ